MPVCLPSSLRDPAGLCSQGPFPPCGQNMSLDHFSLFSPPGVRWGVFPGAGPWCPTFLTFSPTLPHWPPAPGVAHQPRGELAGVQLGPGQRGQVHLHGGRPPADHVFAGRPHQTAEAAAGEGESAHVRACVPACMCAHCALTSSKARLACRVLPSSKASLSPGMSHWEYLGMNE